jgi:hypothetical protein
MSVTSIGHAETGRLWQSRRFWELADKGVGAGGELLVLLDAYRAAAVSADSPTASGDTEAEATADILPTAVVAASAPVISVTITWADGAFTTVYPARDSRAVSRRHPRQLTARVRREAANVSLPPRRGTPWYGEGYLGHGISG